MQAIRTKYYGPSNTRGSYVMASCEARKVKHSWDHSLGIDANHAAAAALLRGLLGWEGEMVGGWYKESCFWVFVERSVSV